MIKILESIPGIVAIASILFIGTGNYPIDGEKTYRYGEKQKFYITPLNYIIGFFGIIGLFIFLIGGFENILYFIPSKLGGITENGDWLSLRKGLSYTLSTVSFFGGVYLYGKHKTHIKKIQEMKNIYQKGLNNKTYQKLEMIDELKKAFKDL